MSALGRHGTFQPIQPALQTALEKPQNRKTHPREEGLGQRALISRPMSAARVQCNRQQPKAVASKTGLLCHQGASRHTHEQKFSLFSFCLLTSAKCFQGDIMHACQSLKRQSEPPTTDLRNHSPCSNNTDTRPIRKDFNVHLAKPMIHCVQSPIYTCTRTNKHRRHHPATRLLPIDHCSQKPVLKVITIGSLYLH